MSLELQYTIVGVIIIVALIWGGIHMHRKVNSKCGKSGCCGCSLKDSCADKSKSGHKCNGSDKCKNGYKCMSGDKSKTGVRNEDSR